MKIDARIVNTKFDTYIFQFDGADQIIVHAGSVLTRRID
jgi:hypothetical protein